MLRKFICVLYLFLIGIASYPDLFDIFFDSGTLELEEVEEVKEQILYLKTLQLNENLFSEWGIVDFLSTYNKIFLLPFLMANINIETPPPEVG